MGEPCLQASMGQEAHGVNRAELVEFAQLSTKHLNQGGLRNTDPSPKDPKRLRKRGLQDLKGQKLRLNLFRGEARGP